MLPPVERLNPDAGAALVRHLRQLGIDRDFTARHAEPGRDSLFSPLTPTRLARHSPDPALAAFRALFCALPDEDSKQTVALANAAGTGAGAFHLRIVRGLFLFSDYLGGTDPQAVMGAGQTTALLYEAALPAFGRVLDLGCGAGTLALLLASQGAEFAIGADINPRAIALARFNAAANGIENAEFREGDLYGAVPRHRFHLIVSQPPYYPAPAPGLPAPVFLHGGGDSGNELPRRVVQGAAAHLRRHSRSRALIFCAWPARQALPAIAGHTVTETITGPPEIPGTRQCLIAVTPYRER